MISSRIGVSATASNTFYPSFIKYMNIIIVLPSIVSVHVVFVADVGASTSAFYYYYQQTELPAELPVKKCMLIVPIVVLYVIVGTT